MKMYWFALSLMLAFVAAGCNSSAPDGDDASTDGGSAAVLEGPALDRDEPSGGGTLSNETEYTSALADGPQADATDDVRVTEDAVAEDANAAGDDAGEFDAAAFKQQLSPKLSAAMRQGDLPTAVTILEEAVAKLPEDRDIGLALVSIRIQNDFRLAGMEDKAAAAKSMTATTKRIKEILGEDGQLPPQLAAYWNINEARRHALAGSFDDVAASLDRAFDAGFTQIDELRDDAFFEAIKDDDKFVALMAAAKEKVRARFQKDAREELAAAESFDFDFQLNDLDDKPVKLADFEGKVVIVDIWGTWCPPCRMEIPHFIELKNSYKDDLAIVGITYERTDDVAQAKKQIAEFMEAEGVNYPCVIGDDATQQAVKVEGFPTTLFIDHTGKVRLKVVGYHPYEKLEGYVSELVAERKAAKPSS